MSKPSYIQQRIDESSRWREDAIRILRWTELQYGEFVYEMGLDYMEHYMPKLQGREHWIDILSRNKIFWSWWRNQWANRDREFVILRQRDDINRILSLADLRELYQFLHSGERLAKDIYPGRYVMDETYSQMVDELIKSEK